MAFLLLALAFSRDAGPPGARAFFNAKRGPASNPTPRCPTLTQLLPPKYWGDQYERFQAQFDTLRAQSGRAPARILLQTPPASGKSTVLRRVAEQWNEQPGQLGIYLESPVGPVAMLDNNIALAQALVNLHLYPELDVFERHVGPVSEKNYELFGVLFREPLTRALPLFVSELVQGVLANERGRLSTDLRAQFQNLLQAPAMRQAWLQRDARAALGLVQATVKRTGLDLLLVIDEADRALDLLTMRSRTFPESFDGLDSPLPHGMASELSEISAASGVEASEIRGADALLQLPWHQIWAAPENPNSSKIVLKRNSLDAVRSTFLNSEAVLKLEFLGFPDDLARRWVFSQSSGASPLFTFIGDLRVSREALESRIRAQTLALNRPWQPDATDALEEFSQGKPGHVDGLLRELGRSSTPIDRAAVRRAAARLMFSRTRREGHLHDARNVFPGESRGWEGNIFYTRMLESELDDPRRPIVAALERRFRDAIAQALSMPGTRFVFLDTSIDALVDILRTNAKLRTSLLDPSFESLTPAAQAALLQQSRHPLFSADRATSGLRRALQALPGVAVISPTWDIELLRRYLEAARQEPSARFRGQITPDALAHLVLSTHGEEARMAFVLSRVPPDQEVLDRPTLEAVLAELDEENY